MAGMLLSDVHPSSVHVSVKPTTPPTSLFQFPPSPEPVTLLPPPDHPILFHPFTIPPGLYRALLDPRVPITIAITYATLVIFANSINVKRKKPWAISRSPLFKPMIIAHNGFLAIYSAWTLIGMVRCLRFSIVGWNTASGLAGTIDSFCKINGPRGIGNAASYNQASHAWSITNQTFHLAANDLAPDPTDVGRLWNEGLAFYGWLFYISKFYEVIDTFIILAKGKKSSLLQTYHHAGAMLCMWAGIRYMSPPIWMFATVNAGIHAIMYTFYLCTALGIKINKRIKQTLTTMQITQFVVGVIFASAHLFVAYQIPVTVPYIAKLGTVVSSAALSATSALPSEISLGKSIAIASASAGTAAWLKKAALLAAGREGLAENVLTEKGHGFGHEVVEAFHQVVVSEETRFRTELQWTNCLDTSGEVFAILLNCAYLAPLTVLFVRFFIKAYFRQLGRRRSSVSEVAARSFRAASKGLSRQVEQMHDGRGQEPNRNVPTETSKSNARYEEKIPKSGKKGAPELAPKVSNTDGTEQISKKPAAPTTSEENLDPAKPADKSEAKEEALTAPSPNEGGTSVEEVTEAEGSKRDVEVNESLPLTQAH